MNTAVVPAWKASPKAGATRVGLILSHWEERVLEWTRWWQHGSPYHAVASLLPVSGARALPMSPFLPGSVEGRGGPALARNSPVDGAEPIYIGDPEPCSQELQAGPVELWGLDFGSPGLALKDEADSIFPDFFP